jgi:chromosome segregation ATPase
MLGNTQMFGAPGKQDPQVKYWEQKVKEHAAESLRLHQQLDAVTKHRDQLLTVLSTQQQGGAALEEAKAAFEAEAVNARQLEQQLAHLQQRLQDFNGKLEAKEQEAAAARQRSAALEHQLTQGTADLARIRTELDTQAAEHATLVSELRSEITEAKQATESAETALREQTARAREVSSDLADLRLTQHDLQRQAEENRKTTADLGKRNAELEQRLADRVGEIQHLRAELDRRGAAYVDEFALRARLKDELRQEYNARLATEQETATNLRGKNLEMQERLNETQKELDELKRHSIDSTSNEAALTKQLHATQALADKAQNNYGKEAGRANRLEKSCEALKQTKEELQEKLSTERKEGTKLRRKVEVLEKRVSARQRSGGADGGAESPEVSVRVRDCLNALAKATSGLEAERRRLENTALHSLDASRIGDELVKSLRSQLRPSADHLLQSIRRLMDSTFESGQKRLVESVLEDAQRIHAGLQERDLQAESGS